jgi:hypothetical protein
VKFSLLISPAIVCAASLAFAGEPTRPTFDLAYDAPLACPARAVLVQQVAARVGYDPLDETSDTSVVVRIVEDAGDFRATVVLREPASVGSGPSDSEHRTHRRTLVSLDCRELVASIALTLASYVDPILGAPRPPAKPTGGREPIDVPPPVEETPPARPEPPARRVGVSLGVGSAIGLLPAPSIGPRAGIFLEVPHVRLALEAAADLSVASKTVRGVDLSASLLAVAVVPCLVEGAFFACGEASVGRYEARATAEASWADASLFGALGLRAGGAWRLGGSSIEGYGFVSAPLSRADLVVGGDAVFRTAPVYGGLAIAIRWGAIRWGAIRWGRL